MKKIGSSDVNKEIRRIISPVLREEKFQKVSTRNNWLWQKETIHVLNIRSVGNYFSQVTGWPPQSLTVNLGIFYNFVPLAYPLKSGEDKVFPNENNCHLRYSLTLTINQSELKSKLTNKTERERKDIWWINPSGDNVVEVIQDIKKSYLLDGKKFFDYYSSIKNLYTLIKAKKEYPLKNYQMMLLCKYLGYADLYKKYDLDVKKRKIKPVSNDWSWPNDFDKPWKKES